MELHENAKQWLETATKGIRFGPDRREVEAELREHIEDKTADMARIFHLEGEEAETEALKRMGDPAEIGRELAKLHKPWLGWIWMASRVIRGVLLTLAVLYLVTVDYHGDMVFYTFESNNTPPAAAEPASVSLGGYRFQIVGAALWEDEGTSDLQMEVRAASPRFWERIGQGALEGRVTVVTADGTRFRETGPIEDPENPPRHYMATRNHTWRFFSRDFSIWLEDAPVEAGDWVTLELGFPIGTVELSAQVEKEAG